MPDDKHHPASSRLSECSPAPRPFSLLRSWRCPARGRREPSEPARSGPRGLAAVGQRRELRRGAPPTRSLLRRWPSPCRARGPPRRASRARGTPAGAFGVDAAKGATRPVDTSLKSSEPTSKALLSISCGSPTSMQISYRRCPRGVGRVPELGRTSTTGATPTKPKSGARIGPPRRTEPRLASSIRGTPSPHGPVREPKDRRGSSSGLARASCVHDANECPIGLRVEFCASSVLFTGDAEHEEEAALDFGGPVTLLQVAHHGSETSDDAGLPHEGQAEVRRRIRRQAGGGAQSWITATRVRESSSDSRLCSEVPGGSDPTGVRRGALRHGSSRRDWRDVSTSDRLWATERDGDVVLTTDGDGTFKQGVGRMMCITRHSLPKVD